ncbi:hypothetical protein X975_06464, partial [Stegodyphus mimosarum]
MLVAGSTAAAKKHSQSQGGELTFKYLLVVRIEVFTSTREKSGITMLILSFVSCHLTSSELIISG